MAAEAKRKDIAIKVVPLVVTTTVAAFLGLEGVNPACLLFVVIAAMVYGWLTADKIGAILIGVIPPLAFFIAAVSSYLSPSYFYFRDNIYLWTLWIVYPGIEGYIASRRELFPTLVIFALLCFFIFVFTLQCLSWPW